MSSFRSVQRSLRIRSFNVVTGTQCATRSYGYLNGTASTLVRFASRSSQPPGALQASTAKKAARRRGVDSNVTKRELDASRKASLLLSRLSKIGKKSKETKAEEAATKDFEVLPAITVKPLSNIKDEDTSETIEIDEREEEIQKRIVANRTKLLWPGIWTFFAVIGTSCAFAYLDARYDAGTLSNTKELSERTKLPQTWYLTPTVIKEGVKAGWDELDKLTIGIVIATIGVHLMKKSPLPFWEKLLHITGEKKYTAFTYPFVHSDWAHLSQNMFLLCWFMPGVVRHLDGDLFHTAALFATVPLITSYLQHFAFRWGFATGLPLNMGSSGAIAAMFGAFCMAFPNEKTWLPSFLVVRLDAMYWGVLYAAWQFSLMMKTPKGGNRPAFLVHIVSLGMGAAYVYFDGKNNLWKPLTAKFAKTEKGGVDPLQP